MNKEAGYRRGTQKQGVACDRSEMCHFHENRHDGQTKQEEAEVGKVESEEVQK